MRTITMIHFYCPAMMISMLVLPLYLCCSCKNVDTIDEGVCWSDDWPPTCVVIKKNKNKLYYNTFENYQQFLEYISKIYNYRKRNGKSLYFSIVLEDDTITALELLGILDDLFDCGIEIVDIFLNDKRLVCIKKSDIVEPRLIRPPNARNSGSPIKVPVEQKH